MFHEISLRYGVVMVHKVIPEVDRGQVIMSQQVSISDQE